MRSELTSEEPTIWNIQVIMEGHSMFGNVARTILERSIMREGLIGMIYETLFSDLPQFTGVVWNRILQSLPDGAHQKHFLLGITVSKSLLCGGSKRDYNRSV